MGLINTVTDPNLTKIISGISSKVKPNMAANFNAVVISGMQLLFSPKTAFMLKRGLSSGPLAVVVPKGIANTIATISNEAKGKMSIEAALPASIVLMCHVLDYAERTGAGQVNAQVISQITQATATAVLNKLGITQQVIANAAQSKGAANGNA